MNLRGGLALLLALALVGAACGSDKKAASGGSAGGSTGSCSAQDGLTSSSIKIAAIFPQTGPSAQSFTGYDLGAATRIAKVNAEGGINGRKLEMVKLDDAGDGAQQVTAGRNAVQSEKAFAIIEASRVDTALAYLTEQNLPVVESVAHPATATAKNTFGYNGATPTNYTSTQAAVKFKELGVTKLAVYAHNSPGSTGGAKATIAAAEKVGIPTVTQGFDIPLGSFDATAQALQVKNSKADGLYIPMLVQSNISFLQGLQQQNVPVKGVIASLFYDPAVLAQSAAVMEGSWAATTGVKPWELDDPAIKQVLADFQKYGNGADAKVGFTIQGWLSVLLLEQGLKAAGNCPTRTTVIDAMRDLKNYDGGGILVEKLNFKDGVYPMGDPPKCSWYVQIKNGKFAPDAKATCGELIKV